MSLGRGGTPAVERFELGIDIVEPGIRTRQNRAGRHRGHDFAGNRACVALIRHASRMILSCSLLPLVSRNG
jgi:hypothetical protein